MVSDKDTTIPIEAEFDTNADTENKFVDKKRTNVKSDLIEITEDKLENILLKYLKNIGLRKSFITPASLLITIIPANLSATFGDKYGITGAVWEALFLLVAFGSGLWLIISIVLISMNWKEASLDNLIAIVKNAKD
ncbi:MAG: hypothetical protein GY730_03025 [bacterium]|nr:hypothetical protein [bacterium]